MAEPELRELALAYVAGKVITSQTIPADLWRMVFMPLAFVTRRDLRGVRMVYARTDRDHQIPGRAINGYPMFTACHVMRARDLRKFAGYVEEARALTDGFTKGTR